MDNTLKHNPVVIVFSVLAGLQVITAGLGLIDSLDKDTVAFVTLVIAAIQAMATFYVRALVTPWDRVVSTMQENGTIVGGPAAGTGGTGLT